jgi:hypothetical protein
VTRITKVDLFSKFRGRKFRRGASGRWYGWHKNERRNIVGDPPAYPGHVVPTEYVSAEKAIPNQQRVDAFVSLDDLPSLAMPENAAPISRADIERRGIAIESLLLNSAQFRASESYAPLVEQTAQQQSFYHQNQNQNQQYDSSSATFNANLTYNTNTTTGSEFPARQPSVDPTENEQVNHMSYLSSLSSGFGDAQIIIPDIPSDETKPNGSARTSVQAPGQTYRQSRKFSWATSLSQSDRDTMFTSASVESAPRFRTVNSWVAQQTGHIQRRQQRQEEVPNMPVIPKALQGDSGKKHQRQQSVDAPGFRQHPGDEVEFERGSRIASTILDRSIGFNYS